MPLIGQWTSTLMFLAGVLLLCVIMFRNLARQKARNRQAAQRLNPPLQPTKAPDQASATSGVMLTVAPWQQDLHDWQRDFKAEIDTKIAVLMAATRSANAAADRLEELLRRAERS